MPKLAQEKIDKDTNTIQIIEKAIKDILPLKSPCLHEHISEFYQILQEQIILIQTFPEKIE